VAGHQYFTLKMEAAKVLQNNGILPHHYAVSQPRRQFVYTHTHTHTHARTHTHKLAKIN